MSYSNKPENEPELNSTVESTSNSYIADAPLRDPKQDKFHRWPFSQRIAQTIALRRDPSSIVIGIYGAWGDGKTTVLNFIEHEFSNQPNIVCFKFNPWRYSDEDKLITFFFKELATVLGKSLSTNLERLGEVFGKYLLIPASALGQAETVKAVTDSLTTIELEGLKNRIESFLKTEKKRVVVLMDDIDRLDKIEIQSVFRLIKLTVDFDNIAYVLAFDDDMVAAALQEKYADSASDAGRNFLEKIIQVPLELPTVDNVTLRNFCFESLDQALQVSDVSIEQEDVQYFFHSFIDGLQIRLKNPRMAKRYGNAITFGLPIMKGEVNIVDYLLVEGIRIFYPTLYEVIKRNPDDFLGENLLSSLPNEQYKAASIEIIERGFKGLLVEEKVAAKKLLSALFPRLKSLYGNNIYGGDWSQQWFEEQRIASSDYFFRYFSYSIPEGDISDTKLSSFISQIEFDDTQIISNKLKELINSKNAEKTLAKLRSKVNNIPCDVSQKLAVAISLNGNIFPSIRALFTFREAFSQAAMLISDLVSNITDPLTKIEFAKNLILEAEPFTFAIEIERWIGVSKKDDPKAFSEKEELELRKIVALRIAETARKETLFIQKNSEFGPTLLNIWTTWGPQGEARKYILDLLRKHPEFTTEFLSMYVRTKWGVENGLSSKGDFEREQYNQVTKIVDPDKIFDSLCNQYGQSLNTQDYPYGDGKINFLKIAQQFTWIHKAVLHDKVKPQKDPTIKNE